MNRLRVVLVTDTLRYGGSERLLVDIARGLDRTIFDVKVCATTAGGEILGEELRKADIEYRVLDKHLGASLGILFRLRRLFREWRPQIVHTFRFTANTYGRIGAVLARVPVVIGTEHVLEHKGISRRLVDMALARFTDRVVVVTQEIADQVHAEHRLPCNRIQLIEEGIDLNRFACVERNPLPTQTAAKGSFRAGIVARLAPQKGHTVFLEAIRLAQKMRPAVQGVVVGDGLLRPELEQWVTDRQMQKHIEFWGFREDLPNVFHELDLFVMTSGWEGLPLALLDAAATGLPFVCTAVGGIQDVFQDGVHGRLVPPNNPAEIANAIVWCLDHYAEAVAMAKNASGLIHGKYGLQAMIQQHESLYLQLTHT